MKNLRPLLWLTTSFISVSACSVLNSFDEILPEGEGGMGGQPDQGDGDGAGGGDGDGDGSGGRGFGGDTSMGGATGSGGKDSGGNGSGGEASGGDGSGGSNQHLDPGLVVLLPQIEGLETKSLYAISPQTGDILNMLSLEDQEVSFAAFEPKRQIWFLNINGRIVPSTFDRREAEWEFGSEGPETGDIVDPYLAFALPGRLVVFEAGIFAIYDTSDLDDISYLSEFPPPDGTLWGVAAVEQTVGGDIQYLAKHCATALDLVCPVELTRISIQAGALNVNPPTTIATVDNAVSAVARGNIHYNRRSRYLAIVVPNKVTNVGQASVDLWSSVHEHDSVNEFYFAIPAGNSQIFSTLTVDPCHSVAYTMINNETRLFGVPLTVSAESLVMNQGVRVQGYGIAYEHSTLSILTTANNQANPGVESWKIQGDDLKPQVTERLVGWTREPIRPRYIAAEQPNHIICE